MRKSRYSEELILPLFSVLLKPPLCGLSVLLLGRCPTLLKRHRGIAGGHSQAWALLLDCLVTQLGGKFTLERHAQRMLKGQIAAIDEDTKTAASKKITGLLPSLGLTDWGQINGWSILTRIVSKVKGILGSSKNTS